MAADPRLPVGLPRTCANVDGSPKTSFGTQVEAIRCGRRQHRRAGGRSGDLAAYPCPDGHGWHLATKPGRKVS